MVDDRQFLHRYAERGKHGRFVSEKIQNICIIICTEYEIQFPFIIHTHTNTDSNVSQKAEEPYASPKKNTRGETIFVFVQVCVHVGHVP